MDMDQAQSIGRIGQKGRGPAAAGPDEVEPLSVHSRQLSAVFTHWPVARFSR
ncbi:hypothetical protein [Streptomyces griseorubiginosus]|uniref:hypothetical protein n=1 Tax=Streptomyces griseorubiginosus TaxID=67304 RepID=UPI00366194BB